MQDFEKKTIKVEQELWATKIENELTKSKIDTLSDLVKFFLSKGLSKNDCSLLIDKVIGVPNNDDDEVQLEVFSLKYAETLAVLSQKKKDAQNIIFEQDGQDALE